MTHGIGTMPMTRAILDQQQVMGIEEPKLPNLFLPVAKKSSTRPISYRIGENSPDIYTGGSYTLRPNSLGHVVAAIVYSLVDYHNLDYKPISGVNSVNIMEFAQKLKNCIKETNRPGQIHPHAQWLFFHCISRKPTLQWQRS